MVNLGDKVKDTITGFVGIAVARHSYLNGCNRVTIQPVVKKDGSLLEAQTFDEPQLELVKKKKVVGDNSTGGPDKFVDIREY